MKGGGQLIKSRAWWKFFPFPWWAVKESGPRKYVDLIDVNEFSLSVYLTMFDHISIMIPHSFFCSSVQVNFFLQYRSSYRRCSIKKAVLKNFAIFTGKHLCWGLFLIKLQVSRPATLLKRDSNTGKF